MTPESTKNTLAPNRALILIQIIVLCAMGCFGVALIRIGIEERSSIVQFFVGAVSAIVVLKVLIGTIEDYSVSMDEHGIEQVKVVHAGRYFVKERMAWGDVESLTRRGLNFRVKGPKLELRLNIASFSSESDLIAFLGAHLPFRVSREDA